jgi:8-oxo-dGTP pyrophosphatase MutT (NUDIX family)
MKEPEHRPWRVLQREYLAHEPWFTVRRERVELPNGTIVPAWYILEYPDWVNVIARTRNGEFVFIDQYRHALGRTSYEIVAGVCDPEDATPLDAARRELYEETGYGSGTWQPYMILSANPTSHANLTHTFLATDVEPLSTQHLEQSEDIRVHLLSYDEVHELLVENRIVQSLMVAPLWRYMSENKQ